LMGRSRRGQSEVIGGLIILTLLFLFAIPLILNLYQSTIRTGQEARQAIEAQRYYLNEKIVIQPVDPYSELAQRAGWIPGVWINNTGTIAVTLDKLYLVDKANKSIYAILDLRTARPGISELVKDLVIDPLEPTAYTPPYGQPITLQPGQSLLIVFNKTLTPVAPNLHVLVESMTGVLHPIGAGGEAPTLFPGRPELGAPVGAWRGVFAPQSGFSLKGFDELAKRGNSFPWRPPIYVYPDRDCDAYYEPEDLSYDESFIYEDPDYPGLYMLHIVLDESTCLIMEITNPDGTVSTRAAAAYSGYTIKIRGYVGTYDTGGDGYGTYFNGYAYGVEIYDDDGFLYRRIGPYDYNEYMVIMDNESIIKSDFDGNGVDEITFYSFLNGPTYDNKENIDADQDGSTRRDALAWTYMVARDISGIDFVKVTVKMNYYWTTTFYSCPSWSVRRLKVFAIVIWKYDPATGNWEIYQYQNYGYTTEKPVQFQETAVFPVEKNGTYRVGVIVYDNYRDFDYYSGCWTDFTMTLEHMIVEYGVYNPFFQEAPPIYIVAIPDTDLIDGIGVPDYMNAENISDPNVAKLRAQADLLDQLTSELDYAGAAGYTIIRDPKTLYQLLFAENPPKYAIIYWLQGNVSISTVLQDAGYPVDETDIAERAMEYRWVIVFPFGEPFGDAANSVYYDLDAIVLGPGSYNGTITEAGAKIRKEAYAYYLFNELPYTYVVMASHPVWNATFYIYNDTATGDQYLATGAFWLELDGDPLPEPGIVVVNPVHIDWDLTPATA